MVYENDNIEGLDASILTNPLVLDYSGHTDTFQTQWLIVNLVDCVRADQVPKSCKERSHRT